MIIVDFCIFSVVGFSTETQQTQTKSLLSLPLFCTIVLRNKVDHMQLIVALEQAFF